MPLYFIKHYLQRAQRLSSSNFLKYRGKYMSQNGEKIASMRRIYLRFHNHYIEKLKTLREEKWCCCELHDIEEEEREPNTVTVADMIVKKVHIELLHAPHVNLIDEVMDYISMGMCDPSDRNSIRQAITRLEIDAFNDYTPKHRLHHQFKLSDFHKQLIKYGSAEPKEKTPNSAEIATNTKATFYQLAERPPDCPFVPTRDLVRKMVA